MGCGPQEAETAGDADASTSAASSSTDADVETMSGSTAPSGSTSSDGSTTLEPTGGAGHLTCEPGVVEGVTCEPAGATRASWSLTVGETTWPQAFDEVCSVDGVDDDGEAQTIRLGCKVGASILTLSSTAPHVPVQVELGAMVHMQVTADYEWEIPEEAFAMRDANERLLVAGLKSAILPRPEPLPIAPLSFELRATDCELIDDGCFVMQRGALAVTMDDMTAVVFDGNNASVGLQDSYRILVGTATRDLCVDPQCNYNGEPFATNALMVLSPEG